MPSLLTILNEETWTQGYYARDKDGCITGYDSSKACKFCLLGAALKTLGPGQEFRKLYGTLRAAIGNPELDVHDWNDAPGRTFEEVRSVILQAEAMLETAPEHKET